MFYMLVYQKGFRYSAPGRSGAITVAASENKVGPQKT